MGWEERGGNRYLYRKHRDANGRVVSEYITAGSGFLAGPWAELARDQAEARSLRRAIARNEREDLEAADAAVREWYDLVGDVVRATLESAGFHRHDRGQWRRRRAMSDEPRAIQATVPTVPGDQELRELAARARKGDRAALDELACALESDPDRFIRLGGGNLAELAENRAVGRGLKDDLVGRRAVSLQMDRIRAELEGPRPSPIERLLADRCVLCWWHVHALEIVLAGHKTVSGGAAIEKSLDRAHRRYLSSLKALASVRKLVLPSVQVNIAAAGGQQVNIGS